MADIIVDGKVKVALVTTISTISAPTAAELTAGTDITNLLTADGLVGFQAETAEVDTTSLGSTFDTKMPGRASFSGTKLRLKKQSGTDTVYTTYVRDTATHVVVRRDGSAASEAFASADAVEVYPVVVGELQPMDPEPNTVQRYELPVLVSSQPNLRAVVAA